MQGTGLFIINFNNIAKNINVSLDILNKLLK